MSDKYQLSQLTLFDAPRVPEAKEGKEFRLWSYSRRELLEQCPRRYYYHYYGASTRSAKGEPLKEDLRRLKTLQNRHTRIGDLLHRAIRLHLKGIRDGNQFAPASMKQWALGVFNGDLAFSRSFRAEPPPKAEAKDPALLAEFFYGVDDREALVADARDRLSAALDRFAAHPYLPEFRRGAAHPDALIEHPIRIPEADFVLTGKLDFAYPEDDRFAVVDWKIGDVGASNSVLQLNSYGIAAIRKFNCRTDQLTLRKISLGGDRMLSATLDEKGIARTRARVRQDLEWMRALQPFGEAGTAEAFTPCDQPMICALCPFRKVCPRK